MHTYQFIIICLILLAQFGIVYYYLNRLAFLTALSGTCANKVGIDLMEKMEKIESHCRKIKGN